MNDNLAEHRRRQAEIRERLFRERHERMERLAHELTAAIGLQFHNYGDQTIGPDLDEAEAWLAARASE